MNPRPLVFLIGLLLSLLSATMLVPAAADWVAGNADWKIFAATALFTLFIGVACILVTSGRKVKLSLRLALVFTNFSWLTIALFGALPFMFSELDMSFTDAFFESMSGITTTGSTVIVGLDAAPPGILLWRAMLQWLGGIGIIVMALSFLPMLSVGGMQLFKSEGFEQSEKILPRAAEIAYAVVVLYFVMTFIASILLWIAGMSGFDAIIHAMTSIATGGFSSHDASLAYFDSAVIDVLIVVFMIAGSIPFVLYLQMIRGRSKVLWHDGQVRAFFIMLFWLCVVVVLWLWFVQDMSLLEALRAGIFNITSIMTGTGYNTADYGSWGHFVVLLMLLTMVIGGCAGSTTCGIKIFRFQILYASAKIQLKKILEPHGVFIPYYNKRPIDETVIASVINFVFVFLLLVAVLALSLAAVGLDPLTALSGATTSLANVGPGLGDIIGPSGTFKPLPDSAKWIMTFAMLLGRLELFTVLIFFSTLLWKR